MACGSILLDTPGMRELQLTTCDSGLQKTFADIASLEQSSRFNNCKHNNELELRYTIGTRHR